MAGHAADGPAAAVALVALVAKVQVVDDQLAAAAEAARPRHVAAAAVIDSGPTGQPDLAGVTAHAHRVSGRLRVGRVLGLNMAVGTRDVKAHLALHARVIDVGGMGKLGG
jgi:hypothetical protein